MALPTTPRSDTVLTEEEIRRALHADRVMPIDVADIHGPLGLEHLAAVIASYQGAARGQPPEPRVRRPIALSVQTWEKLQDLANATAQNRRSPVSAGDLAAAIIEQYVLKTAS
jgi:hypothetical protein